MAVIGGSLIAAFLAGSHYRFRQAEKEVRRSEPNGIFMSQLPIACTDQEKQIYIDRIHKYSVECGCAHGGALASVSLLLAIAGMWLVDWNVWTPMRYAGLAIPGVFAAGLLGKLIGISYARIRRYCLLSYLKRNRILIGAAESGKTG